MFTFLLYIVLSLLLRVIAWWLLYMLWYILIPIIVLGLLIYLVLKIYHLIADEITIHKEKKHQDKD